MFNAAVFMDTGSLNPPVFNKFYFNINMLIFRP